MQSHASGPRYLLDAICPRVEGPKRPCSIHSNPRGRNHLSTSELGAGGQSDSTECSSDSNYSLSVANGSYEWYSKAAIRSRRSYKIFESLLIVIAAAIPVAAVVRPGEAVIPAILGSAVVVLSSIRTVFHWQENYLRFSRAREAVEAERRLYLTGSAPYDDTMTKEQILVGSITRIEQEEMGTWLQTAAERPTIEKS